MSTTHTTTAMIDKIDNVADLQQIATHTTTRIADLQQQHREERLQKLEAEAKADGFDSVAEMLGLYEKKAGRKAHARNGDAHA